MKGESDSLNFVEFPDCECSVNEHSMLLKDFETLFNESLFADVVFSMKFSENEDANNGECDSLIHWSPSLGEHRY